MSLTAYWKFDDLPLGAITSEKTIKDYSGNGNDLKVGTNNGSGNASIIEGPAGSGSVGLKVPQDYDYAYLTSGLANGAAWPAKSDFSIARWEYGMKFLFNGYNRYASIKLNKNYMFGTGGVPTSYSYEFGELWGDDYIPAGVNLVNGWVHIVTTVDRTPFGSDSVLTNYYNINEAVVSMSPPPLPPNYEGIKSTRDIVKPQTTGSTPDICFGGVGAEAVYEYDMQVAHFMFFNHILTEDEIKDTYDTVFAPEAYTRVHFIPAIL